MGNKYNQDQAVPETYEHPGKSNHLGKLQPGSGDIGLAKANNSKDIGLTKDSSSLSRETSKKHPGYDPNNAT